MGSALALLSLTRIPITFTTVLRLLRSSKKQILFRDVLEKWKVEASGEVGS
jgi:hypothetical protein